MPEQQPERPSPLPGDPDLCLCHLGSFGEVCHCHCKSARGYAIGIKHQGAARSGHRLATRGFGPIGGGAQPDWLNYKNKYN